MKRFITVLSSLLVLPAFAEVAPIYYDDFIEYSDEIPDEEYVEEATTAIPQNANKPTTINRSTSTSRAIASTTSASSGRTNSGLTRVVASSPRNTTATSRGTVSRTTKTSGVASRNTSSRNASRTTSSGTPRTAVTSRNTSNTNKPVTARVSANNAVMPATSTSSTRGTTTLTDSGSPLYYSNSSRVAVSNRRTSARSSAITTTTTPVITEEDVSSTASNLTALAELTDYCKAQYAACMDNYCNVLDDNQGRCSCSKNLKNYAKTEESLTKATEEFQEAVQKIRYIGLSGTQIESLFAETEAEISMKSASDTSKLKTSLDAIKKKIIDVSPSTSSTSDTTNGLSLDVSGLLNADFTSGFDLNSFLNVGTTTSNTVSNQRGEQLFKTATNRCKATVLNSCTAQGIDANMITNSYDLEIDKQCIEYERNLNEANAEMKNNVTNAINILQQARLMLAQNRNSYDLRGCVAAIDSCMQDEYVCGSDYESCLDPTGKYLANGEIVKGGTPGVAGGQTINSTDICSTQSPNYAECVNGWTSEGMYDLYATWNYENSGTKNAWSNGKDENLGDYIDAYLTEWQKQYKNYKDKLKTNSMATYLLQKIGYIDENDTVHGMCASVMKQCQDYTFKTQKSNKTFIPNNEVVRQYLASALTKIKVQQDSIISEYAENCRTDVTSCLTTNGYDDENVKSTASKTAVNACSAEITTCMSVSGYKPKDGTKLTLRSMTDWVASMYINCPENYYVYDDGIGDGVVISDPTINGNKVECKPCPSMLVLTPDGAEATTTDGNSQTLYYTILTSSAGGQVTRCDCPDEYRNSTADGKYTCTRLYTKDGTHTYSAEKTANDKP